MCAFQVRGPNRCKAAPAPKLEGFYQGLRQIANDLIALNRRTRLTQTGGGIDETFGRVVCDVDTDSDDQRFGRPSIDIGAADQSRRFDQRSGHFRCVDEQVVWPLDGQGARRRDVGPNRSVDGNGGNQRKLVQVSPIRLRSQDHGEEHVAFRRLPHATSPATPPRLAPRPDERQMPR
jgi:hypothetical protein